jgi:hypothetical protein
MLHGGSVQHSPPVDLFVVPVELAVMQQLSAVAIMHSKARDDVA